MDPWASWVLICFIIVVALDIVLLMSYFVYKLVQWCRPSPAHEPLKEDEVIQYEDKVAIQTKPIPVVYDEPFRLMPGDSRKSKSRDQKAMSSDEFDASMYLSEISKSKEIDSTEEKKEGNPSISVTIHYDAAMSELTIFLSRGKNLKCDTNEEQQQHILISAMLMPDGNILHSCKGIPPNPLFKHKYDFPMKVERLQSSIVKFNVWKIDKYSSKIPFGECTVHLGSIFAGSPDYVKEMWLEVSPRDELDNESLKGEVLVSMQYLPGSETINLNVMRGRGFHFEDFDKDVCVKASAVVNGTVVKNKKTGVTRKNPNPVFNEMIRFELNNEMTLENTTIVLSVNAYRSRGPHKRLVGRAYLGNGDLVPPTGKEYWRKIIENPQKMIAEWQEIQ